MHSGYGEAVVVREVALDVRPGEIFVLLGKNGMGKSTLLKTVMGFLPLLRGRVRMFGEDISGMPPHRIARKAIAYTPQEQALFQDLTVEENLRLALRDDRSCCKSGLERVGAFFPFIPQRLKQRAGTLSGGEQKMLLVARALMTPAAPDAGGRDQRGPAAVRDREAGQRVQGRARAVAAPPFC